MKKTFKVIIMLLISCLILLYTGSVFADQEEVSDVKQSISIEDAIKRAAEQNKELKKTSSSIKKKDILFDDISATVNGEIDSTNASSSSPYTSFYSSYTSLRIEKKNLENQKKQLIIDTKAAYFGIIAGQDSYAAAQESVRLAELKLRQENARYNVGTSTTAQLRTAETSLAEAKTSLAEAQKTLDASYTELNKLLNYDLETRPELTSVPEFKKFPIDKVEYVVEKAIQNSYEIWSAEQAADLAERIKTYEKYYNVGRENVAQAKLDVSTAKDELGQKVRDLCYSINAMEIKHVQLLQQQKDINEKLRVVRVQKDVGMATVDAVVSLEGSAKQIDAGIRNLIVSHINAVDNLKRLTGESVYEEPKDDKKSSSSKEIKAQSNEESSKNEKTKQSVEKKNAGFWVGSDKYYAQGTFKLMDAKPYIKDDHTYVPVRYLAYAMGLTDSDIVWDAETGTVRLTKGEQSVSLVIGNKTMTANGTAISMDAVPEIIDGYTMLPARYVAEGFGYEVNWDAQGQMVQIK